MNRQPENGKKPPKTNQLSVSNRAPAGAQLRQTAQTPQRATLSARGKRSEPKKRRRPRLKARLSYIGRKIKKKLRSYRSLIVALLIMGSLVALFFIVANPHIERYPPPPDDRPFLTLSDAQAITLCGEMQTQQQENTLPLPPYPYAEYNYPYTQLVNISGSTSAAYRNTIEAPTQLSLDGTFRFSSTGGLGNVQGFFADTRYTQYYDETPLTHSNMLHPKFYTHTKNIFFLNQDEQRPGTNVADASLLLFSENHLYFVASHVTGYAISANNRYAFYSYWEDAFNIQFYLVELGSEPRLLTLHYADGTPPLRPTLVNVSNDGQLLYLQDGDTLYLANLASETPGLLRPLAKGDVFSAYFNYSGTEAVIHCQFEGLHATTNDILYHYSHGKFLNTISTRMAEFCFPSAYPEIFRQQSVSGRSVTVYAIESFTDIWYTTAPIRLVSGNETGAVYHYKDMENYLVKSLNGEPAQLRLSKNGTRASWILNGDLYQAWNEGIQYKVDVRAEKVFSYKTSDDGKTIYYLSPFAQLFHVTPAGDKNFIALVITGGSSSVWLENNYAPSPSGEYCYLQTTTGRLSLYKAGEGFALLSYKSAQAWPPADDGTIYFLVLPPDYGTLEHEAILQPGYYWYNGKELVMLGPPVGEESTVLPEAVRTQPFT